MAIDGNLVVKIDGGSVAFEPPGMDDWVTVLKMDSKTPDEQADVILPKVVSVEGLKYQNGNDVTVEDVKSKKFPVNFFFLLKAKWLDSIVQSSKGDSAGNG